MTMSSFCKRRISQSLFVALLFFAIIMGGGPEPARGQEATGDCGQSLTADYFRLFSHEQVRKLQGDLNTLNFDAGKVDGIIGPQTKEAIKRFCTDSPVQLEQNSPGALAKYVADSASGDKKNKSDKQEKSDELLSYLLRNDVLKASPLEKSVVENLQKLLGESYPDKSTLR